MDKKTRRTAVQNLLDNNSYWQVPKFIANEFGPLAAILLAEMLWRWVQYSDKEGWFHRTQENLEKATQISPFQQSKIFATLIDNGVLKVKRKGIPARNWYQINDEKLLELASPLLPNDQIPSYQEIKEQATENLDNIYIKSIYKEKSNKLLSKDNNKCFSAKNKDNDSSISFDNKRILKRRKKKSYPLSLNPFIPKEAKDVIAYWNNSGLQNHNNPNTKLYRNVIIAVKRLKSGTFFKSLPINGNYSQYKTKQWTYDEIIEAVSNFALAATNCDYEPKSEKSKEWLRKQPLPSFLWNEYLPDKAERSLFLKYFESKPELTKQSMRPLKDEYPKMTKIIEKVYNEKVYDGVEPQNLPVNIKNCFIKAAKRQSEYITKLVKQRKIRAYFIQTNRLKAELLVDAALANLQSPRELRPHYLCSDYMFDDIFPRYLSDQAVLEAIN